MPTTYHRAPSVAPPFLLCSLTCKAQLARLTFHQIRCYLNLSTCEKALQLLIDSLAVLYNCKWGSLYIFKVLGFKFYLGLQDLYREYQGALDAEDDEEESNDEDSDGEEMDQDDNNRSKLDQVQSQKL